MIFGWQKSLAEKGHVWKESGVTTQRRKKVEAGTLLLANDINNIIANMVLSFFLKFKLLELNNNF